MEQIQHYFPAVTEKQLHQFESLIPLYREWNERINVISRKDIDNLFERHVLHSLAIASFIQFKPDSAIMDLGTGGGFPGIPLAIMFPEAQFTLIDSIGKKIKVVQEISASIGLENVQALHQRAEENKKRYDFVVTRAVAQLSTLETWVKHKFHPQHKHSVKNGLIALKGGDLQLEIENFGKPVQQFPIKSFFDLTCYEDKSIVYIENKFL